MNREQVMALSGKELRIKAAELLGCRVQISPGGMISELGDGQHRRYRDARIPDYSNDIAAAWELVGVALSKGLKFALYSPGAYITESFPHIWEAQFYRGNSPLSEENPSYGRDESSPARAITRAFIFVMTQEVE